MTDSNYEFELEKPKKMKTIQCTCYYFVTLGVPCAHLFAIARDFPTFVILSKCVRERWLKSNSFEMFEDSKIIEIVDKYFLGPQEQVEEEKDNHNFANKISNFEESKKNQNSELNVNVYISDDEDDDQTSIQPKKKVDTSRKKTSTSTRGAASNMEIIHVQLPTKRVTRSQSTKEPNSKSKLLPPDEVRTKGRIPNQREKSSLENQGTGKKGKTLKRKAEKPLERKDI